MAAFKSRCVPHWLSGVIAGVAVIGGSTRASAQLLQAWQAIGPMAILPETAKPSELQELSTIYPDDTEVRDAIKEVIIARCDREKQAYHDTIFEVRFTNWIGRFVCVVVHVILAMALYFSWREFTAAQNARFRSKEEPQELNLSLQGIALKTSLHGTLLMVAALGFYFLYIRYVFPVVISGSSQ